MKLFIILIIFYQISLRAQFYDILIAQATEPATNPSVGGCGAAGSGEAVASNLKIKLYKIGSSAVGLGGSAAGASMVGAVGNTMAASLYARDCNPQCSMFPCVMAAVHSAGAVGAFDTGSESNAKVPQFGGPKGPNWGTYENPEVNEGPYVKEVRAEIDNVIDKLKEKGFTVSKDGKTITTPKGKISATNAQNPRALANAGIISESEVEIMEEALKKTGGAINAAINKAMSGLNAGGGSGGGSRKPSSSGSEYDYKYGAGNYGGERPQAARTSGLSVLVGGEPVGASTGNLFHQISEAYAKGNKTGIFIKENTK